VPHLGGRDAALRALGFPPYQAAWLTLVCLHSGVFVRRQFTEHHHCATRTTHAFVHRLILNGLARECPLPGSAAGLRYTHVHGRRLYHALGIECVRYRRAAQDVVLFRRLLSLEYVLRPAALPWFATEAEKVLHFARAGFRLAQLPRRFHGPAHRRTRRYFALRLPVAADDRSARFVYAGPGRETNRELRRWTDEHRALWTHLRESGVTVHVAVITRTVAAQRRYSRLFASWLDAPSAQPLTPEERETLTAADADLHVALATDNPRSLERWGGLNPCRRLVISLRKRADPAAAGAAIDSYSTHHAQGLSPQSPAA
jgi:hypothetical protein